jgi:hypothetical protein
MMAQMSLVSLGVKLEASLLGVVGAVLSSMVVVLAVLVVGLFAREKKEGVVDLNGWCGEHGVRDDKRVVDSLSRDCTCCADLHVNVK